MAKTFVLIHGAWHGGWAWQPVAGQLRAAGHRVLAPTLPGLADGDDPGEYSLADVVDFVVEFVRRKDLRDVTLVGHSWAGYVVTGAAPRIADRLGKLVFVNAFIPAADVPLIDELPPDQRPLFHQLAEESGNHTVMLPYQVWQQGFIQDAPEPVQRLTYQLLVPQPFQYFNQTVEPLDLEKFQVPMGYVLGVDDVALPPGEHAWDRFPSRLGITPISAPGSHEAAFTHPEELAEAVSRA